MKIPAPLRSAVILGAILFSLSAPDKSCAQVAVTTLPADSGSAWSVNANQSVALAFTPAGSVTLGSIDIFAYAFGSPTYSLTVKLTQGGTPGGSVLQTWIPTIPSVAAGSTTTQGTTLDASGLFLTGGVTYFIEGSSAAPEADFVSNTAGVSWLYSGTARGVWFNFNASSPGWFNNAGSESLALSVTAIPEPMVSAQAIGLCSLLTTLAWRRRTRGNAQPQSANQQR